MSNYPASPATVEAFTEGDCYVLALEIRRLTGLPLIFVSPDEDMGDMGPEEFPWYHVAVELPDGTVLDIHGLTILEDWEARWSSEQTLTTRDDALIAALLSDNERIYPHRNARAQARRLLNHFNIPTTGRRHRDALPV